MKFFIAFLSFVIGGVSVSLINRIPNDQLTISRLTATRYRIEEYIRLNNQIPKDLSVLVKRKNYNNSICDAWGNDFIYIVTDKFVALLSEGSNPKNPEIKYVLSTTFEVGSLLKCVQGGLEDDLKQ